MSAEGIAAAVAEHFPEARVRAIERLEGGVSAQVFRVDLLRADGSDQSVVLRVMGKSGLSSAQEYALLQALHAAGLPTPRPIRLDDSRRRIDASYVLMDFVEGSSDIPEGLAEAHMDGMAETLARIHRTPTASLPELPSRLDPVRELPAFLPDGAEWRPLRDHCAALAPNPFAEEPVLLHGDFWARNLLWKDGRIVAVLDWEDAALGDPLSDVACAQLELSYLFDDGLVDRFLSACKARMSIDPLRLALWRIYVASAAQCYMGGWGLEPSREARMRQAALRQIREAAAVLGIGAVSPD